MLILAIPIVQTSLGNYATKRINKDFGTNINIEKIGLQLNGDVELKNIYIEDYRKDTLISITELNTSILNYGNLSKGKLEFGDIDIIGLVFNIKTYKGTMDTNLDVFVAKLEGNNPKKGDGSFLLSSSDVSIYNSIFRLSDGNKETTEVLHFRNLNINATNFLIKGSDVSARINTLSLLDSRGLAMENLMTDFAYTLKDMTFANLEVKTPHSILKGDLKFSYKREDLQFFTDKVLVSASFKDSNVLLDELNVFYDEFGNNQSAKFNANISGTLNDLKVSNLKLNTNRNTRVYGDINFKNLFNKEKDNFYMNGSFRNLSSTYKDLKALLPNVLGASIPTSFDRLGMFIIIGNSQVTTSKVIADVEIITELGFVDSNLEIARIDDIDNASYKGNIVFEQFDFGTFLDDPSVGNGSLNFDVNGKGFITETINTQVKGDVFEVTYNDYNYKGLKVAGNVRNKIFDGNLNVNDKNLKLNFAGLIDFSEAVKKYDFEANVGYANLKVLNFVKKDSISIFKSRVKMNMNASDFDDAYGKISFSNTSYKNQNDNYYFNKFEVFSRFENDTRFIEFNSPDIIEGDLKGRFVFKDLGKLFENSLGHIYTNYVPHEVATNQGIDFNFKIYNKIIEVVYPEIELGKNTFIRGRVESDEENFKLTFKSPKIRLLDNFANNIELQVDNSNPLFNTYLEVDSLKTKHYNVSKFNLINVTVNDTLFMRSEFKGGKRNNDSFNLSFYHTINEENKSVIGFKKSDVTIKNNKWFINENKDRFNKISFNKDLTDFDIDKLKINNKNEEIKVSGFIRDSTEKDLKLNFKNVDLVKITPDIDSLALAGNVNGELNIFQKNGNYLPTSKIVIDHLKVNNFLLGSFDANITGNETLTNYKLDATIKNDISESFKAKGNISVIGKQSKINVNLDFNNFNLVPLNPLLEDVLTNIRGEATGDVNVIGNINHPDINGSLTLNNSGLGIPYLNVDYSFQDKASVTLKKQSFIFNKIQLRDTKFNSKGELNGSLSHLNFSKWNLDLDIKTPRLLVLDTKEAEDVLYYGTGFIEGRAKIFGPTEQLVIDVVGETKRGTVFKIPLNDAESFGDNTFIHFITKEEKEARQKGEEVVFNEIKGLELDFDLDLTEEAEVEIIIDKSTGHSLKGRGRGGLLVEINTNGKFKMWGDFSVFEGVYNFAYGGIIRKEFIVQPGGTLAWNGDPLNALMDMNAIYKTQANPSPLLDNPINRSIPVELNISLKGDLEQPDPDFSFQFPNVNSTIKSELQYRLESDDDRQNQALYFLATGGSFKNRGAGDFNVSGTITERLNGIIGNIFSNEDSKLNIGLNYEAGENRPEYQTGDRVGVTLQTQISDRVLINGKVGVPVSGAGATETVIAGDVEIDFLLNEDGTLTAKVFNRENSIRNFGDEIGYTQGIGLSYNVDFDTFKELLQNFFKKKEKEEVVPQEKIEEEDANALPNFITVKPSTQK
ncbi:translocation/assembly module TamB domain-containing protein [Flavivirga aquimarina]|uniref:Translocation/assembly module TamB domain-containing protein n=1 Tax=Flavivirga aquimarina TaxID=2027862 RepID=A0ABT8WGC6_9FLAO|nr:translocation/assembly module TamB [Flavivirga aquimarina]MDO5972069.1 translocation/assembly module TamB domain-containing protein [Flavivirga aquimarina]